MTQRTKIPIDTEVPLKTSKEWRMAIPTDVKELPVNNYTKKMLNVVYIVVTTVLLYKLGTLAYDKKTTYDVTKKNTTCPTLLSISRSARDTLLVMKAESLCTEYVLDNIQ